MKDNLRGYAVNFLIVLNVFVFFLLIFENKLVVPHWLQPFGRMHPLILHFPIVLLLLSMVMEFFRFKTIYYTEEFYQNFTSNLLLIGVIFSGITVIMGLFLSKEEGYSGSVLTWHKWAGINVFFLASAIYACRGSDWYKAPLAKAGAVITTLCLIFAGHFGAALTHGDNFIWQSVLAVSHPVVPVEEAILFDHVIKPVFEKKCVSCHNPDKLKGKLILTDSTSILKGGKTGELFVAGKPEESLLLKRIHLPLEDKKHMPPSGKTQLTADEIGLLRLWIKADATFNRKVATLPTRDSLRLLAVRLLQPDKATQETFDFAAADEQTLRKLNTDYRVISPLAWESPALTVNIYNKDAFTSKTLSELSEVKTQILSLDMSKMPIKDADLKTVSRFENLRRLNLNFTDITGPGLQELTSLSQLKSLSLSGTKINYQDLRQSLPYFKSLNTLALWDTGLSSEEIEQLQSAHKNIEILGGFTDDGSNPIKLNPPRLKNKLLVFDDSIILQLYHPVKGVGIRYTVDGTDPDSISSLFEGNTVLHKSVGVKARACKDGWLCSDIVNLNVYRSSHKPDTAILLSPLNSKHTASGAQTFFDNELGSFSANSPAWANNWAGVKNNDLALALKFRTPRLIRSVGFNMLVEPESFIFPAASIEIWGGQAEDNIVLIGRMHPELPTDYGKPFIKFVDCMFKPQSISYIKIIAKPVMKLPAWDQRKRKAKPALLLDEIVIN